MNEETLRNLVLAWRETADMAKRRAEEAREPVARASWTGYASAYLDVLEILEPMLGISTLGRKS